jgi:restriction endonuclease S subunit
MIICSIIQKSQLEGATRLDAEYYQPEYLEIEERIKKLKTFVLGEISFITDGQHGYFKLDENSEIRQITAQHIIDGFIDKTNADRLSKETHEKNLRASLKENDIVLSTVGTVGNAGVVTKEIPPANLDQNVARINLNIKDLDPWYLVVFLNSKYGQLQINRNITGQVQQRLSLETLRHLEIPIISEQEHVGNLLKNSYKALTLSKSLYSQAEDLLLGELGLKNFKLEEELSYIVNLSDVKSAHRADAEYFQPKYDELIKRIAKNEHEKLIKLANRVKTKIKPIPDRLYKYIEISDIDISDGFVDFNEIIGQELPANARIPIKGVELVISKVRPTRGAISILPPDFNKDFICSSAFSVFTVSGPLKEYLFVVLRSIIGKIQFEKPTTGTSYPTITDQDVENILVPILPQSFQQKIADLVLQSHQARKKAKELLEKAKREVEEFIEGK